MKKQLTAFLTALLLSANALPVSAADARTNTSGEYEGLAWTLSDGVLTVLGEGKIVYDTGFPDGDSAKYPDWGRYRDEITKVVIEKGVTGADAEAFQQYPVLETVVLPEGFESISARLFRNCPELREIEGLEHVKYFQQDCLNGTAMTAENPFIITNGRLQYCDITEAADIVVPEGVTEIGPNAFGNLMDETSESLQLDFFNTRTPEDLYFTITLPDTVQVIDDYAFANLPMLTDINIPASVTKIGEYAFLDCVRLDALTLGKNVQSVGSYAFFNCKELDTLTVLSKDTQFGTMAYGTLCDINSCLMETDPDYYTSERMAELLEFDPYFYDPLVFYTVDWFGTQDYLWIDEAALMETISHYLYPSPTARLRSTADSTAHSFAESADVQFLDFSIIGDANFDGRNDSTDAAVLLLSAAELGATGESGLTAEQEITLDVNGDGRMDAVDGAWILRYAAYTGGGGTDGLMDFVMG